MGRAPQSPQHQFEKARTMRERRNALFPVAISPARAAEALDVHRKMITAAIKSGELPVYCHGLKRRILIEDLVAWIRHTWRKDNG